MSEHTPLTEAERIASTLAQHRINYHHRNIGGETSSTLRYTSCDGCDWKGGWHDEAGWEAHVAQALAPVLAARLVTTDYAFAACGHCGRGIARHEPGNDNAGWWHVESRMDHGHYAEPAGCVRHNEAWERIEAGGGA